MALHDVNPLQQGNAFMAATAITSPYWLPAIHDFSTLAADLLPILGAFWLVIQICLKIYQVMTHKKDTDDKE